MDRLPHSLAALGSSSSFLISWSNRSSVSRSLSPCVVSLRFRHPSFTPWDEALSEERTAAGWEEWVNDGKWRERGRLTVRAASNWRGWAPPNLHSPIPLATSARLCFASLPSAHTPHVATLGEWNEKRRSTWGVRDGAKHSEAEVDRGNMTSKRLVSWRSLNPRSLPPLGFSHFTRSPHGVSEVRHEPREGREVGERYGHSRRLRLSRSLLSPRLFPPLSIPALSLPSFFRSERAAGEWREGKRREERELNGKLSHVPGLTHRFHAPITSARRMFVPGSLVTSLPMTLYPRSRGERSGSELPVSYQDWTGGAIIREYLWLYSDSIRYVYYIRDATFVRLDITMTAVLVIA